MPNVETAIKDLMNSELTKNQANPIKKLKVEAGGLNVLEKTKK
jgi:hypothetical protein